MSELVDPMLLDTPSDGERVDIPPHDLDAEAAVLGAILLASGPEQNALSLHALRTVLPFLRPDMFYSEAHRLTFQAAVALHDAGEPIDIVTVATWLKNRERLEQVGGLSYLRELLFVPPAVTRVRTYAVTVHEHWRVRQAIGLCQRVAARGYTREYADAQTYLDAAIKNLQRISVRNPVKPIETNDAALQRVMREWSLTSDPANELSLTGFPTGLYSLDKLFGGLMPGRKTGVIALSGVGKTAFALQVALHIARRGVGVLYFTSEMERWELVGRALASEANVHAERIKKRMLDAQAWRSLTAAQHVIAKLPLRIDESPALNVDNIDAIVANMIEEFPATLGVPLGVVVVDYLQRLEPLPSHARAREHEQIAASAYRLKNIAKTRQIAVLEVIQGKRERDDVKNGKWRPSPNSGIAGAQRVGKELDDAIFIAEDGSRAEDDPRPVTFWVAKQRNGRRGEVPAEFHGSVLRFVDPNDTRVPLRHHVAPEPMGDGIPYTPPEQHCFSDLLEEDFH
jgi:replicative DNA helicase